MKKFFPRLRVKDICILGLLVAITTVLAVYCTFRIGIYNKIPLKFISVFVTALLYGPFYGGIVGAMGDLLNCLFAPSGMFLPQITVIEFLCGFVFGLFFYEKQISKKSYIIRMILCVVVQFVIDMGLTTAVFVWNLGWFPNFISAFLAKSIAGVVKPVLNFAFIFFMRNYTERIRKLI